VDGTERRIDRVFVVSSHEIGSSARESIIKTLENGNIYKKVSFIDCQKLVDLIDKHMPEFFFDEYEDFVRYLNSMMENIRKMDLSAIGRREQRGHCFEHPQQSQGIRFPANREGNQG